jgi:hypothetical protein
MRFLKRALLKNLTDTLILLGRDETAIPGQSSIQSLRRRLKANDDGHFTGFTLHGNAQVTDTASVRPRTSNNCLTRVPLVELPTSQGNKRRSAKTARQERKCCRFLFASPVISISTGIRVRNRSVERPPAIGTSPDLHRMTPFGLPLAVENRGRCGVSLQSPGLYGLTNEFSTDLCVCQSHRSSLKTRNRETRAN